jgi:hypothetical protein
VEAVERASLAPSLSPRRDRWEAQGVATRGALGIGPSPVIGRAKISAQ